jgi:hypothetical protein
MSEDIYLEISGPFEKKTKKYIILQIFFVFFKLNLITISKLFKIFLNIQKADKIRIISSEITFQEQNIITKTIQKVQSNSYLKVVRN